MLGYQPQPCTVPALLICRDKTVSSVPHQRVTFCTLPAPVWKFCQSHSSRWLTAPSLPPTPVTLVHELACVDANDRHPLGTEYAS